MEEILSCFRAQTGLLSSFSTSHTQTCEFIPRLLTPSLHAPLFSFSRMHGALVRLADEIQIGNSAEDSQQTVYHEEG